MIIYKEFSSLVRDLGFSAKTLYSVSNNIQKHYRVVTIPKSNGELRELHVPDNLLKAIQRKINQKLLSSVPISRYATAYRMNGSTAFNAECHIGKPMILKLDIRNFFDRIIYPLVKERVFPATVYSEQNRVLLSLLCIYKDSLPQGAPTSPSVSNIIMFDFDNSVGAWCAERGINYTRYCDDMTFSGSFKANEVISFVSSELKKLGFYLNRKKTRVVDNSRRQTVTGIVVNKRMSVCSDYKKDIRAQMHYIRKFGIDSHLDHCGVKCEVDVYASKLLGKINYVLSIERDNSEFMNYKEDLAYIKKHLN